MLYFKEDADGLLWLLFCTGLSLDGPGQRVDAPERPLSIRTSILSTLVKSDVKPTATHGAFLCCHCGEVKAYDAKRSIDFYTLISEYESKVRRQAVHRLPHSHHRQDSAGGTRQESVQNSSRAFRGIEIV